MQGMNAIFRRTLLASAAAGFVLLTIARLHADVCVDRRPKVRRICGTIVDQQGAAISGVAVTILKDGTTIAGSETADTGEFNFDVMEPGKYELETIVRGFVPARYQLILSRPTKSCRNALLVKLQVGGLHCEGDTIRETKRPLSQ
jgi:hypothetical protein